MTTEDRCYECTGNGDDYYWDEESQQYMNACVGLSVQWGGDEG